MQDLRFSIHQKISQMLFVFSNQIRLIHYHTLSEVSHLGIIIKAGSRDELPNENGLAHYIEHGIFKGTKKRNSVYVLSRMDSVGGELNAYTTKEETVIYTSFLTEYFSRASKLLADLLLNSQFLDKEMEKEKEVIVDEINMYRDSPSEDIMDKFDDLIFPNHSLGKNILGTEESVRSFTQNNISEFICRNYSNSSIVISYVGPLSAVKVKNDLEKLFSSANFIGNVTHRQKPNLETHSVEVKDKKLNQLHCVFGKTTFDINHPLRLAFSVVNNILGGPGMNSKLNLNIREKYGFCYTIDSNFHAYSDTGVFNIYFGTDIKNYERTYALAHKELLKMIKKPITQKQANQAKCQLKGQLALSQQNLQSRMLANAKSVLLFNEPDPLSKSLQDISALNADKLNAAAQAVFGTEGYTRLVYR